MGTPMLMTSKSLHLSLSNPPSYYYFLLLHIFFTKLTTMRYTPPCPPISGVISFETTMLLSHRNLMTSNHFFSLIQPQCPVREIYSKNPFFLAHVSYNPHTSVSSSIYYFDLHILLVPFAFLTKFL